jgi:hypothetical protein
MFKYLYATNEIQSISSNEKLKSKEARVNSRKKKVKVIWNVNSSPQITLQVEI